MIGPLATHNRVIVPDHMGFGKSETPQDRPYTLQTHTENLTALIEHLDLRNITFVIQDWGGPAGTAFTARNPDRVKRMVYMNTVNGYGRVGRELPRPNEPRWFEWIGAGLETPGSAPTPGHSPTSAAHGPTPPSSNSTTSGTSAKKTHQNSSSPTSASSSKPIASGCPTPPYLVCGPKPETRRTPGGTASRAAPWGFNSGVGGGT